MNIYLYTEQVILSLSQSLQGPKGNVRGPIKYMYINDQIHVLV